jgi:hypothetical protein
MSLVQELVFRFDAAHRERTSDVHNVRLSMLCLLALLALAGGCSLALDSERHQCNNAADCEKILGLPAAGLSCVENLCQTYVECTAATEALNCNQPALPHCSAENKCVACLDKSQCGNPGTASTTMECVNNVCKDEIWGCLDEPDNRPAATQPTATFLFKAKDPLADPTKPTPWPAMVSGILCLAPSVDAACMSMTLGTTSAYELSTGTLTLGNVVNDRSNLHMRLLTPPQSPPELSDLPVEYYTNRPARDTETVDDVNFIAAGVLSMISKGTGDTAIKVNTKKASVNVRIHNCKGELAAGVTLTLPPAFEADPLLLHSYVEGKAPNFDLTETQVAGVAGLFNLPIGTSTTLIPLINAFNPPRAAMQYSLFPLADAITLIDLYPRHFAGN